jgi:hypothetical protein
MTSEAKLVQVGVWDAEAKQAASGTYSGPLNLVTLAAQGATVSGTGTTQSNSTALAAATVQLVDDIVNVTTTGGAAAQNTAQLTNQGAAFITVFNGSANELLVFPPANGAFNGQPTNVSFGTIGSSFGIAAGKSTTFTTADGVSWFAAHAG